MQAVFTLSGNCRELGWQPICRFKSSSCSSLAAPRCWDGIGAGMASGGLGRSSARAAQLAGWVPGVLHEVLPRLPTLPSSCRRLCSPQLAAQSRLTSSQSRRPAAGQHGAVQRRMRQCRQPAGPLPGWAAASAAGRGGLSTRHYLPVPSCTAPSLGVVDYLDTACECRTGQHPASPLQYQ